MTRNLSYTYDFETHKNLFQKQSVLFYGSPVNIVFQNKATVNENPIDKLIRELKEENERLKKSLGGGPVELGSEAAGMTEDEKAAMRAEIEAELRAQESFQFLTEIRKLTWKHH